MMTGSAFYDSEFVNTCLSFLGFDSSISDETTIKIPGFFTLLSSLIVLGSALGQRETVQASIKARLSNPFFPPQDQGCRGLDSDHRPALRYSPRRNDSG